MSVGFMTGAADKLIAEERQLMLEGYDELLHKRYRCGGRWRGECICLFSCSLLSSTGGVLHLFSPFRLPLTSFSRARREAAEARPDGDNAIVEQNLLAFKEKMAKEALAVAAASRAGPGADSARRYSDGVPGHELSTSIDSILAVLRKVQEDRNLSISWEAIISATWKHTKDVYWSTYVADCAVWPLLQYINFSYVPVRYQFLYVNACNLAWNTFLSFQANAHHG